MSPPRVTYREDALPRTHLSHLAVGRAPKELERRSDVPLASLPRRARGGYHGRIYYPYGRIISGGSTGHGCDATRPAAYMYTFLLAFTGLRAYATCVLSCDASSLSLSYVPSRDSTTTNDDGDDDDNGQRPRRRVPEPSLLSPRRSVLLSRRSKREREKRQRLTKSINRGHREANSCFGMSQHNVVAHVVPDVIRVFRAYVPRPETR